MFVLGLQGSPRVKGNTNSLLTAFLSEAERLGARTEYLDVAKKNISPCQECGVCEDKGFCPIDDDMQEIYPLLRQADIIVMATPIFFYGPTAQMKAVIDRSQALWARKYIHRLTDPGRKWRQGFLLALGATKGKNLFEGVSLTAKYFFDAVGASFDGSLTYKQIEGPGDITKHPTAFAQYHAGDRIEVISAGSAPAEEINPIMEEVMREKGIDMAFRKPKSIEDAASPGKPDLIISMGCEDACPLFPGVPNEEWDLEDPAGKPLDFMRQIRDKIEEKVKTRTGNEDGIT
ncbi:MAG: NAD(P)H-dependent oxidoreductase [Deltaproteobacteria bacterium]|nr:NAD(P)H-dependent oxidoreductase [Deltaproteobacteria bacterium]